MFVEDKKQGEVAKPHTEIQQWLLDAANYIEKHGWCQHELRGDYGRVCLWGALYAVDGRFANINLGAPRDKDWEVGELISQELESRGFRHVQDFFQRGATWNDEEGRTQEEVVAFLRHLATM